MGWACVATVQQGGNVALWKFTRMSTDDFHVELRKRTLGLFDVFDKAAWSLLG